jgi:hypothetical protein
MSVEATLATWRLSKKQVTAPEKLFLLSCANRAGESHECWPSLRRLCADTGLDRKTVIKVRQSVVDKMLLEYTGSFQGRSGQVPVMRLTYIDSSVSEFTSTNSTTSPKNGTGTSPKNGTGTSPKNGTGDQSQKRDTESKRENLKEEPKNTPYNPNNISEEMGECENKNLSSRIKGTNPRAKGTSPRQVGVNPRSMKGIDSPSVRFEEFWNLYPVKEAKKTCLQKWKRSKLDNIADIIIGKVGLQLLNDRKWIAGFAPNPLTYINQERWNDELDMRPRGSTAKQQSTDSFHNTMAKYKKAPTDGYYDEQGNFAANYL